LPGLFLGLELQKKNGYYYPVGSASKRFLVDDEIEPQLDEHGRIKFDKRRYPIILLKAGVNHKQFSWQETLTPDATGLPQRRSD
jgi:hypothetical protein